MERITVLLADDHAIVREGLRTLLELEGDFEVVGEAANGLQAVELAGQLRPAVVVLDIAMPQLNGLEAAQRIRRHVTPPPKVLILSGHSDDAYVEQVAALGVMGYLVKQTSAHILAKAIRQVYRGGTFYSPAVTKRMENHARNSAGRTARGRKATVRLTPREREILQLIAEGNANKEVAADLGISTKTVEKHRQSIMHKLELHDIASLTRYAISAGIIESCVQCTILPES